MIIIRIISTIALIYLCYRETGIFTALSLLLIFASIEILGIAVKKMLDRMME